MVDLISLLGMIFPGLLDQFSQNFHRSRLYLDYLEILVGRVSSEPLD